MKTKSRPRRPAFTPSARCFFVLSFGALSATAQSSVILGASHSFAVLAGSTVTDAGGSVFYGDVGVSPGTAITGIVESSVFGGSIHLNDTLAMQAHADAEEVYNILAGLSSDFTLIPAELGGLILAPGVYTLASSAQLTGNLTLDGEGYVNPQWVFQIGTTLTTASDSNIVAINGANSSNVFFQVGTSATLGTGTDFVGNILADQSISTTAGTKVAGRLLAINAAVTLIDTAVTIPETSALALTAISICGLLIFRRRNP
jgi:hypothetical protein